jgi:NAD(P)-dependent dehydrogenase (short-subunit alcohol dehydrogenase family)
MLSAFSLRGKQIVVTGASSGIGRAISIACSEAGARILLIARNRTRLDETVQLMSGDNHLSLSLDLTDFEQLESSLNKYYQEFTPIDGLVHAAGIELTLPLNMTKPHHLDEILKINVISGIEIARITAQRKNISDLTGSSFVFISSIRALHGEEGSIAYSSSKGALLSTMKSMARELAKRKIRVNAIAPSVVMTPLADEWFKNISEETKNAILMKHPLGLGKPDDIAYAALYFLSDASRWITGSTLVLDGGYSI